MDLSKMESGNLNIKKTEFKLYNLFKDLKEQFQLELSNRKKNNISLICKINKEEKIFTDYKRLNQVLNNLILNAIKFTNDGYIKFGFNIKDNIFEFFVEDTGIGILNKNIEKIFERFYQIDRHKNKKQEGTGLGLTISKAFIELLGGNIWVDSVYGSGTTVYFSLPNEKPTENELKLEKNDKENETNKMSCSGKTILIIEDNDLNYELLEIILLSEQINIERSTNHIEFFDIINKKNYDIILLDIQLPNYDGWEILKWLKENKKNIPVIVQTAFASTENEVNALKLGASNFISKPINAKELLKMIKIICNTYHL